MGSGPRLRVTGPAAVRLTILAVGKIGGAEATLFERYAARLRPRPAVIEIAEARGAPAEIKRRETEAILAAVPASAWLVALDLGGDAPGSEAFAKLLAGWRDGGKHPCFVVGGAEGLDAPVISRAAAILSLGPLTWPHLLARAMLAEQLYRAQAIADGHPYHRSGRP